MANVRALHNETPRTVLHTARPQGAVLAEAQRQILEYVPGI